MSSNKYYLENRDKIIERTKEWNKNNRKPKGKLANKRNRIRLSLKKNEKRVEEYKSMLEDLSFGVL